MFQEERFFSPFFFNSFSKGVTVGRLFCGWACPFGLVQDLLAMVPVKKEQNWMGFRDQAKHLKWVLILYSIIMSILVGWRRNYEGDSFGVMDNAPFEVLSPSGTLFAYLPWMFLWKSNVLISSGFYGWAKLVILIGTLAPSLYIPRFFCRYVCPLGGALEVFAPFKFLRVNRIGGASKDECNKVLDSVCSMGVRISSESDNFIADGNCTHCGACVAASPDLFEQAIDM